VINGAAEPYLIYSNDQPTARAVGAD